MGLLLTGLLLMACAPSLGTAVPTTVPNDGGALSVAVTPKAIDIPAINAFGKDVVPLTVDANNVLETPDVHTPQVAGWYTGGAVPGDPGTSVIVAHVDGFGKRGLFYDLSKVKIGDTVSVDRTDKKTAVFTVTKVAKYDKTEFPTDTFYSNPPGAELHLATCGGRYDAKAHRYLDQWLVWSALTSIKPTS